MNREPVPDFYDDLNGSLVHAWRMLVRGVADRRSPCHSPTVATIGNDGRPRLRTVILRGADPEVWTLRFHTDRRSDKVQELATDSRISLLVYDPGAKIQIRVEGVATVYTDDGLADAAWAGSRSFSQICYGSAPAPGQMIANGGAFSLPVGSDDVALGRANFAAVQLSLTSLEWLYLAHAGHRRARFTRTAQGTESIWLAP
ncbi:MAG: pyridoxamine 5'-phosphate oxidase family protein [Bosea sp. (in: a-proteobacteria)]